MMVRLMGLWFSVVIFLLGIPRDQCAQIIGGKVSLPHSRPYMAKIKDRMWHICGGTLIKANFILTAAHCDITKTTEIILGINSEKDTTKQVFTVKKGFRHPYYDKDTNRNDIMLLQLNKPAKLDKNVEIVKLPKKYGDLKAKTQCLVAGWGSIQSENETPSDVLREVNVSVIARSTCTDKKHYNCPALVTKNMVCAGDKKGGKDACIGDSGGPLMCSGEQRGIVSFGTECGNSRYPGVYTLLTDGYSRWIKNIIEGDG